MVSTLTSLLSELKFLGFTVAIAVLYGIAHDMVTAHLAVEYFTEHRVRIIPSESPVAMAFLWGFLATFWVGALGAALLMGANGLGRWPNLEFAPIRTALVRMVMVLYGLAMGVLFGVLQFTTSIPENQRGPDFESNRRLMAVALTHEFSYAGAAIGFVGLAFWIGFKRKRLAHT